MSCMLIVSLLLLSPLVPAVFSIPLWSEQLFFHHWPFIATTDRSAVLETQAQVKALETSLHSGLSGTQQEKIIHALSRFPKNVYSRIFSFFHFHRHILNF